LKSWTQPEAFALGGGDSYGVEDVTWPGRLERRVWRGHEVLIDGAHNPAGARALAAYLREVVPHRCRA
jgi:dihydrofolate synthase/folylpolyglutamate synthase